MTTDASATPPVAAGTVQVWSDLLCPFAYVGLLRLRRARERLGLDGAVRLEHRTFPLELFNGPHPRRGTDTEAVGLGQIEPEAQFRVWTAADDLYPHTVLLAAEAVHAASAQSRAAGEELDLALRRAFWTHSRSISHRQVILEVAGDLADGVVDVTELAAALDSGRHRADVMRDFAVSRTDAVPGSPTFRLHDGTTVHNPGIQVRWEGPWAAGFPVVGSHDPGVYDDLLRRAAQP
ncbi:dithiol-disulfide isomerase [Nonomuraea roseoviolacea subsp. roseoviolacea]|uniref:DsbA family dithiol-disulfide isomerase n=1 Tax=Nonomuraea roseoviolacea subsp. carminata TaxID=160689 RepID=A0ABT1K7N2_9ACTN|nr:DsbA family protein [Nonomuraea roseoviolacea]MCP2349985.1 putative DsbA family dithiol-disulfide isomerase [Nonomuraea roseoviolacea subsp. carminata]